MESTTGRTASSIKVSQDQFMKAVLDRTGSTIFATRLVQETQEYEGAAPPQSSRKARP